MLYGVDHICIAHLCSHFWPIISLRYSSHIPNYPLLHFSRTPHNISPIAHHRLPLHVSSGPSPLPLHVSNTPPVEYSPCCPIHVFSTSLLLHVSTPSTALLVSTKPSAHTHTCKHTITSFLLLFTAAEGSASPILQQHIQSQGGRSVCQLFKPVRIVTPLTSPFLSDNCPMTQSASGRDPLLDRDPPVDYRCCRAFFSKSMRENCVPSLTCSQVMAYKVIQQ